MTAKEIYQSFCEKQTKVPLFLQYNWLNGLFTDAEWEVLLDIREGEVFAALPYVILRKNLQTRIVNPMLCPYMGIYINYPDGQKLNSRYSFEQEVMDSLIERLPYCDSFSLKCFPLFSNHLPWIWKGYKQTSHITYVFPADWSLEQIQNSYKSTVKREIKKANENLSLSIVQDAKDLFAIKQTAAKLANKGKPVDFDYLSRILTTVQSMNCGSVFQAVDGEGIVHASCLFIWDEHYVYYLYGGVNPDFVNSGAMSMLMHEGIQLSRSKSLAFNFEGSMLPSVERFFRNFGGIQQPYSRIFKNNSLWAKVFDCFR